MTPASAAPLPPISSLLPQRGGMCLLARVLDHDPRSSLCEVEVARSALFLGPDGGVPGFVALEYMAQCAAAHGSLLARARGLPPRPGLFLGARRLHIAVDSFEPEQRLHVRARHHRGEEGLVVFDAEVRDARGGEPLAEGRINVYAPRSLAELEGGTA